MVTRRGNFLGLRCTVKMNIYSTTDMYIPESKITRAALDIVQFISIYKYIK